MNLHPSLERPLGQLRAELARVGIGVKVLEIYRPPERQEQLYRQGRSAPGKIVTYAKAYESPHQWGLAVDVEPVPVTSANWSRLRSEAQRVGFSLLGDWDPGHLQHPAWPVVLAALRKQWQR